MKYQIQYLMTNQFEVFCILLSNNHQINAIDAELKNLHNSNAKDSLEQGLTLAQAILGLFVADTQSSVEDIVADGLLQMPNAERQDAWFVSHPWMEGAKSAFDIFDGRVIPLQAKFFWLKKKTAAQIAGSVHFTANWEDFEYTRQGSEFKVGIDFFLSPDAKSLFIALSNSGKLRVMELNEKLNRTQVEIFERWLDLRQLGTQPDLHSALWQSFQIQSVNSLFYKGVSDAFLELVDSLVESGKAEQDAKLFSSRLLGRLIFTWFLRKMNLIAGPVDYFNPAEFESDSTYYKRSLETLFFRTLDEPTSNRLPINGVVDLETPYLNGGLFAPHENDWVEDKLLTLPRGYFTRLFEHFQNFNFTVDESTPEFEQVAIDPEMLGRVFESLLATQVEETGEQARKAKGTFYTPREIVFYMCRESISTYLISKKPGDESFAKSVKHLLETADQDWAKSGTNSLRDIPKSHRDLVIESVSSLKSLDPACGSGAFPLGLLSVLTKSVMRLTPEASAYDVKSKILRNSIYGSDIEPMAIEIAKLRAWLALIVEETDKSSNVQPLPNLEFKFVCANSLVHLAGSGEVNLFDNGELESELSDIRTKYFESKDPIKKSKLKERFKNALNQESVLFGETERSSQLRTFNPFSDNSVAGFFDPEVMFGITGFDVVIGNPPYVDSETMTRHLPKMRDYIKANFETALGNWDLFIPFIEKAVKLTKPGGVVSFIVKNSVFSAPYAQALRKFLASYWLQELRDFGHVRVFESAAVDTCIIRVKSQASDSECQIVKMGSIDAILSEVSVPISTLAADENWLKYLMPKDVQVLLTKLSQAKTLKDQGVLAAAAATVSEAYEIAKVVRNVENPVIGDLKLLNTGAIDPYLNYWGVKPIKYLGNKYSHPVVSVEDLRVVNPKRATLALEPKLIVIGMGNVEAYFDQNGTYLPSKTTNILTLDSLSNFPGGLLILLGVVNSAIARFWYLTNFLSGGMSGLNGQSLVSLPIPELSEMDATKLELLVKECLENTSAEAKLAIDEFLFKAYGLSLEERALLTSTVGSSR